MRFERFGYSQSWTVNILVKLTTIFGAENVSLLEFRPVESKIRLTQRPSNVRNSQDEFDQRTHLAIYNRVSIGIIWSNIR